MIGTEMSEAVKDKLARIALAIQRSGADHLGDVDSVHKDFLDLVKLIPEEYRFPSPKCPHCGGNLGGFYIGRLETHAVGCPNFPI